jgi:hypothetical protein
MTFAVLEYFIEMRLAVWYKGLASCRCLGLLGPSTPHAPIPPSSHCVVRACVRACVRFRACG